MDAGVSFAFLGRQPEELLFGEVEELVDERLGEHRYSPLVQPVETLSMGKSPMEPYQRSREP